MSDQQLAYMKRNEDLEDIQHTLNWSVADDVGHRAMCETEDEARELLSHPDHVGWKVQYRDPNIRVHRAVNPWVDA